MTSDVICPWCYIGKRRLEKAIVLSGRNDVLVRWHPFELNPEMPPEGMNRREYRTAKFGSWARSLALEAQVAEAGRGEGVTFAFDKIARTPNTLPIHRLIHLAGGEGLQDRVVEAFFCGYFEEGQDLSNPSVLLEIATGAGIERSLAEAALQSDEILATIRAAEARAQFTGVQGVPHFVIQKSVALSGARDPNAFLIAFDQADPGHEARNHDGVCQAGNSSSCEMA